MCCWKKDKNNKLKVAKHCHCVFSEKYCTHIVPHQCIWAVTEHQCHNMIAHSRESVGVQAYRPCDSSCKEAIFQARCAGFKGSAPPSRWQQWEELVTGLCLILYIAPVSVVALCSKDVIQCEQVSPIISWDESGWVSGDFSCCVCR